MGDEDQALFTSGGGEEHPFSGGAVGFAGECEDGAGELFAVRCELPGDD